MNLYELNQAGYLSLPTMSKVDIQEKSKDIFDFLTRNKGEYYLLLCNELRYYTIFDDIAQVPYWINELIEVVDELGELKAIEVNESMIEFWISRDNECHMYAFFNYDEGVIRV